MDERSKLDYCQQAEVLIALSSEADGRANAQTPLSLFSEISYGNFLQQFNETIAQSAIQSI